MSHLIAIAVGPVQEFIAAARRTRDLWFGSHLLSEISRAVAKTVEQDSGETNLIFPASSEAENVANVILAVLPTGDPKTLVAKAKSAAQDRWLDFAKEAKSIASGVIRQDIWIDQINDVIEFYAAWVPHTNPGDYKKDRASLMRLLAGRKNLREFHAANEIDKGLPKSSLDGQRATVLKEQMKFPSNLRIRQGEQLDIIGLVKRVAGGNAPYPSVSRVAADPWVRGNSNKPSFKRLIDACKEIPSSILHRLDRNSYPNFQDFPFEGTAIYVNRHQEWLEEIEGEEQLKTKNIMEALNALPEPSPYLAILVADGDKMGAAISNLPDAKRNRAFSRALAGFASDAKDIVTQNHGVLIYAGGDDVVAFLPVDKCFECARILRDKFVDCLKTEAPENTPTLSVGIAIGHCMENLEDLLEYGRAAEKNAKKIDGKDALAVHLHKRGGGPIKMASRWETQPEKRLMKFASLMKDEIIPTKLPYELRALAKLYENWPDNVANAINKDLVRVLAKKATKGVDKVSEVMNEFIENLDPGKLNDLAEEMLVARLIATVMKQAGGES
jgi:CRISPR-associated protein Cmr2